MIYCHTWFIISSNYEIRETSKNRSKYSICSKNRVFRKFQFQIFVFRKTDIPDSLSVKSFRNFQLSAVSFLVQQSQIFQISNDSMSLVLTNKANEQLSEVWGDLGPKGGPKLHKIGSRRDLKFHIFSAKGTENFEKNKVFVGKLTFL